MYCTNLARSMYAGSVAYMCEIVLSEDVLAAWLCQTIIQHFIYIFAEIFLGIQPTLSSSGLHSARTRNRIPLLINIPSIIL